MCSHLDAAPWRIGTETTTDVRNIYKYYVAYRLTLEAQARRPRRAGRSIRGGADVRIAAGAGSPAGGKALKPKRHRDGG
jgi:hypothetical protein